MCPSRPAVYRSAKPSHHRYYCIAVMSLLSRSFLLFVSLHRNSSVSPNQKRSSAGQQTDALNGVVGDVAFLDRQCVDSHDPASASSSTSVASPESVLMRRQEPSSMAFSGASQTHTKKTVQAHKHHHQNTTEPPGNAPTTMAVSRNCASSQSRDTVWYGAGMNGGQRRSRTVSGRSRAIAIQRQRRPPLSHLENHQIDQDDDDQRSNSQMYDMATWRMYRRIVDHRQRHPPGACYYEEGGVSDAALSDGQNANGKGISHGNGNGIPSADHVFQNSSSTRNYDGEPMVFDLEI